MFSGLRNQVNQYFIRLGQGHFEAGGDASAGCTGTGRLASFKARSSLARTSLTDKAPLVSSPFMNIEGVASTPTDSPCFIDAFTALSSWALTQACNLVASRLCFWPCARVSLSSASVLATGV